MKIQRSCKITTFETIVPQSPCTCRNLGVFGNAQTRRVQSELQSGRYSAPIANACDLSVLLSGFTNPDNTNTTPSCKPTNSSQYLEDINYFKKTKEWTRVTTRSFEKLDELSLPLHTPSFCCFFLQEPSPESLELVQEGSFLFWGGSSPFELDLGIRTTKPDKPAANDESSAHKKRILRSVGDSTCD